MNAPASAPGGEQQRNMAGRQLGRYEVLTQLASGGMAAVYIARAIGVAGFERLVAIKVLHPHLAYEEEFISMFLDEARLAARIRHPNVVPTLDISDTQGDGYFLVMEYIEGDHLGALLGRSAKQGKRIPADIVAAIVIGALSGLGAAHDLVDDQGNPLNIVHRDVSPHNVMVGVDGISRLTDFGVAKAEVRMASTRAGQFKGKLSYMAPEQASTGDADQRSDLFSMGIILWESLTGRRLFRGENNAATLAKILNDPIPLPSSLWADLEPYDALLAKALNRDPDARFQSAEEFIEGIEEAAKADKGIAGGRAIANLARELTGAKLAEENGRVKAAIESLGKAELGEASMPIPRDGSASASMSMSRSSVPSVSGARMVTMSDGTQMPAVILSGQHQLPMLTPAPESTGSKGIKALVLVLLLIAFIGGGFLAVQVANQNNTVQLPPVAPAVPTPAPTPTPNTVPPTPSTNPTEGAIAATDDGTAAGSDSATGEAPDAVDAVDPVDGVDATEPETLDTPGARRGRRPSGSSGRRPTRMTEAASEPAMTATAEMAAPAEMTAPAPMTTPSMTSTMMGGFFDTGNNPYRN